MTKDKCYKEKDLAILQTDSQWIKEELIKTTKKIDEMIHIFTEGEGKISKLNNVIYGNGNKENSILHKVQYNSDYILGQKAQLKLLKGLIGLLGLSNIFLVLKIFI